jgi:hypothetical protein
MSWAVLWEDSGPSIFLTVPVRPRGLTFQQKMLNAQWQVRVRVLRKSVHRNLPASSPKLCRLHVFDALRSPAVTGSLR